ncbi:transposase family protein [Moorena sp. SIO3I6]|uniref:transposase family protein n=1 Tax=Moorena sp. SIO3I6 TaxID=2607831 RepID=UPI0013F8F54B|nr:transposase family protein [Moorena sp. SIO3I6]NEP29542.1 transposase family protein [Moorena sp. SIO3I6]
MSQIAIIEAFAELEDPRRRAGQRHALPLCLALFTVGYAAGNQGFLAIGDWISSYREQLIDLFKPPKNRLPSYSTVRRALLHINYEQYSLCLAKFFNVQPVPGETISKI